MPCSIMSTSPFTPVSNQLAAAASRRSFLRRAGLAGSLAAVAPAAATLLLGKQSALADEATDTDLTVLNFALNLEYLEAEFYTYATTGQGIESAGAGVRRPRHARHDHRQSRFPPWSPSRRRWRRTRPKLRRTS